MIGWIVLGLYCVGYVLLWRTVVWWFIDDIAYDRPDGFIVAASILLGSLFNGLWPLILAGIVVRAGYRGRERDALYAVMPRRVRRERELREREQKIARLERELKIGRE